MNMGCVTKKWMNKKRMAYFFTAVLIFGIVMILFVIGDEDDAQSQSRLRQIHLSGVCQTREDGEKMPLNEGTLKKLGACSQLILTGHFDGPISANEQIFMYLRRVDVEVYQNDFLIYSYGRENLTVPLLKSGGNVWIDFYAQGISPEDEIKIVFHNPYPANTKQMYSLFLNRLYVGDKMTLFLRMLKAHSFSTPAAVFIFLMGMVLIIVVTAMQTMGMEGLKSLLRFGLLMAGCGLWTLIDFCYISLISSNAVAWDILEAVLYLTMPILALLYIRDYMVTMGKWVVEFFIYGLLFINIAYLILQAFGIVDGELIQEGFRIILPIIFVFAAAALFYELRLSRDKMTTAVLSSALIFTLFAGIGRSWYVSTGNYSVDIFNFGFFIFIFIQYIVALVRTKAAYRRARDAKRMERELAENKTVMMVSQIQPHFLYNSISCIRELCLSNPGKAYDALAQFSHFLRGNMDSLSSNAPIPFTRELRHVKNYLALELLRFEELLQVEYQLEITEFYIPALTLQPIVENAVRYGISRKTGGGTVLISTREEKEQVVITISDTGVGFDVKQKGTAAGSRSHIGISNVRERLARQCNGTMHVSSIPGEGTIVHIYIPKT